MSDGLELLPLKGERDDPRVPTTFFAGAISVILLVVTLLCLDALYRVTVEQEAQRKIVDREPRQLLELEAEQRARLDGYRWVDRNAGVVAIPIDRAIELIVDEARREGERP